MMSDPSGKDFIEDLIEKIFIILKQYESGLRGEPNTTVIRPGGKRHFDSEGKTDYDRDDTNHGNPKKHPDVSHEHDWDWTDPLHPKRGPVHPTTHADSIGQDINYNDYVLVNGCYVLKDIYSIMYADQSYYLPIPDAPMVNPFLKPVIVPGGVTVPGGVPFVPVPAV